MSIETKTTPYMFFKKTSIKTVQERLQAKSSDPIKKSDVTKELRKIWKELSPRDKAKWQMLSEYNVDDENLQKWTIVANIM